MDLLTDTFNSTSIKDIIPFINATNNKNSYYFIISVLVSKSYLNKEIIRKGWDRYISDEFGSPNDAYIGLYLYYVQEKNDREIDI